MNTLKIAENLVMLRKQKKITQEELADFIGVTKASVSKWETGQSMPDILLLPQLATYFNVTVDALLGYEPQLSREQIRRMYHTFAAAFAARPFADVLAEVRAVVHQYYACYPLLLQLCVLYLNHYFMANDAQEAQSLLEEAGALCTHILENCKSVSLCGDATSLKALIDLQLGNPNAVIDVLEPTLDPSRLSMQNDATLIRAYQLAGQTERAVDTAQISMYLNLLFFVGASVQYLTVNGDDLPGCEETIRRVDSVAGAYRLSRLHPNTMAQFSFQAALIQMALGKPEQALKRLSDYAQAIGNLFDDGPVMLHGDDYFTRLEPWFDNLALGPNPPRDKALIKQSALQGLRHPAFEPLRAIPMFQAIQTTLQEE